MIGDGVVWYGVVWCGVNLELGGGEEVDDDGEDVAVIKMAVDRLKKPDKQVMAKRPPLVVDCNRRP